MGSTRRAYTEEYKAHAVAFVINDGRPIVEVARNIGVHEITLGKWVKKARESSDSTNAPLEDSERAELERLRAENAELKMQVEFAKKWRPGSRKTSSEIRCDRGLGGLLRLPGRVHVP